MGGVDKERQMTILKKYIHDTIALGYQITDATKGLTREDMDMIEADAERINKEQAFKENAFDICERKKTCL